MVKLLLSIEPGSPQALLILQDFLTYMSLIRYFPALSPQAYQELKVISQTTTLGNVVKFVHRKSLKDVKFKDFVIPSSGCNVLPVFSGAHFDQKLHEGPHEFKPWRWEDKEVSKKVSPYGGGLKACPGADLAKLEISFFLHHLVLNYRWKVKGEDYPVAYPFVEFTRGLLLDVEPAPSEIDYNRIK